MSISIDPKNGVRLRPARKTGRGIAALIIVLEAVFSVFLYMSLAEKVFVVIPAAAAPGVPGLIAYQGMLTDTSGNPLGGAGSAYCFRYSIWDSQTSGSQLWPQPALGDASTTPSNSTTTVTDGVFSDELGRTDTFGSLDFGADTTGSSTYFLQVQVSTSSLTCATGLETLSPRQQITADAWSQTSQSVYGNQLRTLVSNNTVQLGTGAGVVSGWTLLSLDVAHGSSEAVGGSCTQNGTLWYDSTLNKALVCANDIIQPFSNGTSSVTSIGTSGTSTILLNNVFLSAYANLTLSQNGQTINFSAAAPGGDATLSRWEDYLLGTNTTAISLAPADAYFQPFILPTPVAVSNINLLKSFSFGMPTATSQASSGSQRYSYSQGISLFSRVTAGGATSQMSVVTTASMGFTMLFSYTSTSEMLSATWVTNSTGGTTSWGTTSNSNNLSSYWMSAKYFPVPLATTLTAGEYWMGYGMSSTTANANVNVTILSINQIGSSIGANTFGVLGNTSAGSRASLFNGGQGYGSVLVGGVVTNNTMPISTISASNATMQLQYFNFADY
jgi:hypothetical protein